MTASTFRAHLEALGWTQRGLAALLGLAHNTVHRWALDQAVIPERYAAWIENVAEFIKQHPPPRP
jgi:transcriptional regulator with XRE-family HTH domain